MKLANRLLGCAAAGALILNLAPPARGQMPIAGLLLRIAGMQLAPAATGDGSGTWIIPTDVVGQVSAILDDDTNTQVFQLEAELTRYIASGAPGADEEGGLYGTLLGVDRLGNLAPVAMVEGQWLQHADGTGYCAALIKARTGNPKAPLAVVGTIEGMFGAPTLSSRNPRSPGVLFLRWRLFA